MDKGSFVNASRGIRYPKCRLFGLFRLRRSSGSKADIDNVYLIRVSLLFLLYSTRSLLLPMMNRVMSWHGWRHRLLGVLQRSCTTWKS